MCPNDLIARLVPERFRLQAIRQTSMRGWARRKPATSRQENRRHRRADRAPVREQRVVGTATVFILPDDILQNTVRAFSVSATSPTGYSALGAPTGRDIAPANGPDCIETAPGYGDCGLRSVVVNAPGLVRFDLLARALVNSASRELTPQVRARSPRLPCETL